MDGWQQNLEVLSKTKSWDMKFDEIALCVS